MKSNLIVTGRRADISKCGLYRYMLYREWQSTTAHRVAGSVLWVMLNPSTADASIDDPTIRRCMGFADAWGYRSMYVGNLYAWRATDPKELPEDFLVRRGPDNDLVLRTMSNLCEIVVLAYGTHGQGSARTLKGVFNRSLFCLGETKDGKPRHPLYLPSATPLQLWA